ncbi:MAG: chemotaxis protein CheX, partial [Myxococcota bacterium]
GGPVPDNTYIKVEVGRPDETKEVIELPRVAKREYRGLYEKTDVPGKYTFKMSYAPSYTPAQLEESAEVDTDSEPKETKAAEAPPPKKPPAPKEKPKPIETDGKPLVEAEVVAEPEELPDWLPWALAPITAIVMAIPLVYLLLTRRRRPEGDEHEDKDKEKNSEEESGETSVDAANDDADEAEDDASVTVEGETPDACFLSTEGEEANELDAEIDAFVRDSTHTMTALYFELCGEKWKRDDRVRVFDHTGADYGAHAEFRTPDGPGRIGLLFDRAGAEAITRAMFMRDSEEDVEEELINDAIQEFLNLYLGKLKAKSGSEATSIGLPTVLESGDDAGVLKGAAFQHLMKEDGNGQVAIVWLSEARSEAA